MIKIEKNKHIGIIFRPRSGSTVLRKYLSVVLDYVNLSEYFNHKVIGATVTINNNEVYVDHIGDPTPDFVTANELIQRDNDRLGVLDELAKIKKYAVYNIFMSGCMDNHPELIKKLSQRTDTNFFLLERSDLLYSFISARLALISGIWHNNAYDHNHVLLDRNLSKIIFPVEAIVKRLNEYVAEKKLLNESFKNLPVIYYEQFQQNPSNMMNLFEGIPKKIIDIGINKFSGDHRELVSNLDEIESIFNEFVQKHIEYFPQYQEKLETVV